MKLVDCFLTAVEKYSKLSEEAKNQVSEHMYLEAFREGSVYALNNQWVPVSAELPQEKFDDGYEFVFVRIKLDDETYLIETDYIRNGKWELHPQNGDTSYEITHWMPIPKVNSDDKIKLMEEIEGKKKGMTDVGWFALGVVIGSLITLGVTFSAFYIVPLL